MTVTHDIDWQRFDQEGYLNLGQVASNEMINDLCTRIDDIMLGKANVNYDAMLMQLDSSDGAYDSAGPQTRGHKGARLDYRKIEQLEHDPLFLAYMQLPLFATIAERTYPARSVACFRAMFMNKPAGQGTELPVHQDRWSYLDRDPLITIYTALDAMDESNGCVEIVPRSHHALLNPDHDSGFLTREMASEYMPEESRMPLRLKRGEVALLHNWTLHCSGINRSNRPRRAFSVCLMDAATRIPARDRVASTSIIFGRDAMTP